MGESQAVGMEHEATLGLGMVERVTDDGMAVMGEMDADLVSPSCFQLAFDQSCLAKLLESGYMSFSVEALFRINEAFPSVMAVTSDFIFVDDSLAGKFSLGKSPIFTGDFFVFQEAVENGEDKGIFGEKDGTAGFFVQTVNDIAGLANIA